MRLVCKGNAGVVAFSALTTAERHDCPMTPATKTRTDKPGKFAGLSSAVSIWSRHPCRPQMQATCMRNGKRSRTFVRVCPVRNFLCYTSTAHLYTHASMCLWLPIKVLPATQLSVSQTRVAKLNSRNLPSALQGRSAIHAHDPCMAQRAVRPAIMWRQQCHPFTEDLFRLSTKILSM